MDRTIVNTTYKGRTLSEARLGKAARSKDGVVTRAVVAVAKSPDGHLTSISRAAGFKTDTGAHESLIDSYIYGYVDVRGVPERWTLTDKGRALAESAKASDIQPVIRRTFAKRKSTKGKPMTHLEAAPDPERPVQMSLPTPCPAPADYPHIHEFAQRAGFLARQADAFAANGYADLAEQTRAALYHPEMTDVKPILDEVLRLVADLGGI